MPLLYRVMVIFGALYYSSLVCSENVTFSIKAYSFGNRTVYSGTEYIDGTGMVYATCISSSDNRIAACCLSYESSVFTNIVKGCNINFVTELRNGKLEILEIRPWGPDKIIFMYRDTNQRDIKDTQIVIYMVAKENCRISVFKWKADNRDDMKPQIFISTSQNTYDVVFMNSERCGNDFCKMTLSENRVIKGPVGWFPNTGLVHALEPTDDKSQKLLINVGEASINRGITKIYLLGDRGWKNLGFYYNIDNLGWSTTNSIISYCTFTYCMQFDHAGGSKGIKLFNMLNNPTLYAALYNRRNGEHLALICDTHIESSNNYHVIRIGVNGDLEYSYDINGLSCSQKPKTLNAKFFEKNEREYCLSIFHSIDHILGAHLFKIYCFVI